MIQGIEESDAKRLARMLLDYESGSLKAVVAPDDDAALSPIETYLGMTTEDILSFSIGEVAIFGVDESEARFTVDAYNGRDTTIVSGSQVGLTRDPYSGTYLIVPLDCCGGGGGTICELITSEEAQPEPDGENADFTILGKAEVLEVYLNGLHMRPGADNDYTFDGDKTITFNDDQIPQVGDTISISYEHCGDGGNGSGSGSGSGDVEANWYCLDATGIPIVPGETCETAPDLDLGTVYSITGATNSLWLKWGFPLPDENTSYHCTVTSADLHGTQFLLQEDRCEHAVLYDILNPTGSPCPDPSAGCTKEIVINPGFATPPEDFYGILITWQDGTAPTDFTIVVDIGAS